MRAPRTETWKKLWGTPVALSDEETEQIFDEVIDALIPTHMQVRFAKRFGVPKEKFNNRYFTDRAVFKGWDAKLSHLGLEGETVFVEVVVPTGDEIRGYRLKGQTRRALKDIVIDDVEAVCAVARTPMMTIYIFAEAGTRGCIVLASADSGGDVEV